jgi:hypothetical protein
MESETCDETIIMTGKEIVTHTTEIETETSDEAIVMIGKISTDVRRS